MAEFVSEASLDLFQDFFHPREETADDESDCDTLNRSVSSGNHGFRDTSQGSSFVKTAVHQHNIEEHNNTIVLLSSNSNNFIQEIISPEAKNNSQQLDEHDVIVRLQNLENLKKSAELNNECEYTEALEDGSKNLVHGVTLTVKESEQSEQKSDENDIDKACAKSKRGISFPKDTFISGYFEPPDPWKNAPSWTPDELVAAYKKSCELHGTKPIAKLVQQLQACSPGKLEESLSLKGEKLDQKQCECLEEVLRRVQFKVLDLESSHLDEECAVALFDMIEYYESACQLNISCNRNIQTRGWQACSRLVRRTPSLTYLDLRGCDLNERNMPIFGRALKLGCHLTILHMENMTLSGRPLVILVAALKMNETLQELFLADNKLMPTDGVQLGNLLHYNRRLSLLDLRNNHLQDVGASHISDGLVEQGKGPGLRTLVLWNNAINYQAMPALGQALIINETLETLNVGHNAITNEGVHLLKDGLLKTNSLLRLGLQGARITDEGAVALAEYIADSTILLRIDLRDNEIKTGGLMALSHAMRVNRSVTRIDLDKEPKKDSSMKDYAEQQSLLLRDIYTFQQRNIQAALQREEEQQIKLEAKPVEVQATENGEEKVLEQSPLQQEVASSGLLESNDGAVVTEKCLEPLDRLNTEDESSQDQVKIENVKEDEELNDIETEDEDMLQADIKLPQRPSVLFPYFGLQPQASLDSPMPVSGVSPLMSELPGIPQSPPLTVLYSHKDHLSLSVGSTPGEMILSPQYFPKQFVRKIFSVSRVSEDPSWQPPLSTCPTPLCTFASANSLVSLAPSLQSSLPTPLVSLPAVLPETQHSPPTDVLSVCPSSSLFHDLVDETVRTMVSPITDGDIQDVSADTKELEHVGDSLEQGVALAFSGTSDSDIETEPSVFTSCTDSSSQKPTPTSVDSCDNSPLSGTDVIKLSPSAGCVLPLAGSGAETRVVNLTDETAVNPAAHHLNCKVRTEGGQPQDCLSSTKDIQPPVGVSPSATWPSSCSAQADPVSVAGGMFLQYGLDKLGSGFVFVDRGGGDGAMPARKDILTQGGTLTEHSLQHLMEFNACCVEGFSVDEVITSAESNHPFLEEELLPFQFNNSSNGVVEDQGQEQPTSHYPPSSPASQSMIDFNQSGSCFSREDQEEQTISSSQHTAGSSQSKLIPLFDPSPSPVSTQSERCHLLSLENPTSAASVTSKEAVCNDRVRVNPDRDVWSGDQDSLSIKNFNQELTSDASLLQQLTAAGSVRSGDHDDDSDTILAQLQPPDEFERELDAMLAIVQSELPWPLKDS